MDISIFFEPVLLKGFQTGKPRHKQFGDVVNVYSEPGRFPDLDDTDIVILGVNDDRNSIRNEGCCEGPDPVREELYRLYLGGNKVKIADLGNMLRGHSVEDTYFALTSALEELIRNDIVPVIIGGSQDLTFAQYKAYEKLGRIINIAAVDPSFDIGQTKKKINSRSYLSHIILQQPNYLFNYTNIGFQSYFVDQDAIILMNNLLFDAYRLGVVRSGIDDVEPMVRNADMLSMDISAIRMSDAPGNANAIPHGFYGEETCQIMRYAGMSDKMSSIGIYEYNPRYDNRNQTAQLISQLIWYFIDGFYNRKQEFPFDKKKDVTKFRVTTEDFKEELIFYKSKKSERWWMEVPIMTKNKSKYERLHVIPCSYKDYQTALNHNIPDRWWQAYQKLM